MAEYKIDLEDTLGLLAESAVVPSKQEAIDFLRDAPTMTAAVFKREDEKSGWNTVFVHLPTAHAEVLLLTD